MMNRPLALPLKGVKVIELAGLAPVPFCGLVLADFGADVLLIDKKDVETPFEQRLTRGKQIMTLNFKSSLFVEKVKELCEHADVLLDPFRPGVLEDMGLDPVKLLERNQKLIVARLTGYGQYGFFSQKAGHDINFLALSGIMPKICGISLKPPANILGDFAGGSLLTVFAIVSALYARHHNGYKGVILDCSMTEGISYLGTFVTLYSDFALLFGDDFSMASGNCPIYRAYETKDQKFMAVGALEPKFFLKLFHGNFVMRFLCKALGLNSEETAIELFSDPTSVSKKLENIFLQKTQQEWTEKFADIDVCVTPILDLKNVGNFKLHDERHFFHKMLYNESDQIKFLPKPTPLFFTKNDFFKVQNEKLKIFTNAIKESPISNQIQTNQKILKNNDFIKIRIKKPFSQKHKQINFVQLMRNKRQADFTARGSVVQPWGGDLPYFNIAPIYYGRPNPNLVYYPSQGFFG